MPKRLHVLSFALFAICVVAAGCAGQSNTPAPVVPAVTTTPGTANIRAGDTQTFAASVTGITSTAVTWSVNGVAGGNTTVGTIDTTGAYVAPAALPSPNTITIQAISQTNPAVQGSSAVTLLNPIPVIASVTPNAIGVGSFTVAVTGSKFVNGAKIMFGGAPLTTVFNQSTYLSASGTTTAAQAGTVNVTVQNPDPGLVGSATSKAVTITTSGAVTTDAAAVRFLEQSTFGPTSQLVSQVKLTGFSPFLSSQFSAAASTYPDPGIATGVSLTPTQQTFFTNGLFGPDQVRQRVALALSEIWVTSGNTIAPQGMAFYMNLLSQDAFVNYRQIMYDVTLSPAMGAYLNMVNNDKPNTAANTHANENYARELMQLFTLGLYKLNQDASLQHDASGNPIPTYTQADVQALALAFTGWTYPTMTGATRQTHNPTNWIGPMEGVDTNHDMTAKTFLGTALAAGRTTAQDLGGTTLNSSGVLDIIFNNASLPPFVCMQLIQHLVTSNPSAAYVRRVSDVFVSGNFAGFGSGQRGDMQAVIAAILVDPEARRGDTPSTAVATDGHLREPILYIANMLRAFGSASDGIGPVNFASNLSEPPLRSPSVFNFFPPDYQIPASTLLGPEFSLQTTATALARINLAYSFVFGSIGSGTTVDFTPYATIVAGTNGPAQLISTLNTLLLHGTLSSSSNASILAAVNAVPAGATQSLTQAKTAIYLILSSSQYQIEQ
jgi:uncharacterized protein (DUF1800 family)